MITFLAWRLADWTNQVVVDTAPMLHHPPRFTGMNHASDNAGTATPRLFGINLVSQVNHLYICSAGWGLS